MYMDAFAKSGRNLVSIHKVQSESGETTRWCGLGRPNPSGETKCSGANGERKHIFFSLELTTDRIGNHTRLFYTLLNVLNTHTYDQHSRGTLTLVSGEYAKVRVLQNATKACRIA